MRVWGPYRQDFGQDFVNILFVIYDSKNGAKSSEIIVFIVVCAPCMLAGVRSNTPKLGNGGHRGIERSMRPRVAHRVRRSGAPRRSRSQQPVLEATPPPAPLHRAEALELGNLNRLTYLVVSPLTCQGDLGRALGSGYSRAPQLKREHNMLHGIIAVCPQTGGLLYAKAYAPSFGLPTVCTPASVRRAT